MLGPNDIETQLTQRRLDIEALNLTLKQLQVQLNAVKTSVAAIDIPATTTSGDQTIFTAKTFFKNAVSFASTIVVTGIATFNGLVKAVAGIVTGLIYPAADSTTAIKFTKADGTTAIAIVNTSDKVFVVNGFRAEDNNVPATGKGLEVRYNTGINTGNIACFDRSGTLYLDLNINSLTLNLNTVSNGSVNVGGGSSTISFFAATPAAKQTLSAYTSNAQGSAYTGINNAQAGTPYAQVTDLNTLRVAYENLRTAYDDLRSKLKTTTLMA